MWRVFFFVLLAALPVRGEWILLKTPQVDLVTDAGEKAAHRVLDRMATVRQVLGQGPRAERPLRVFLFASEREFHSYAPGSATEGFFQSGPERDYIVLPAGSGLTRTITHEYVHRILNRSAPRYPRWLDEGLAEFYSTLEVRARSATIGVPIESHLATLGNVRWLTAQEMEASSTFAGLLNERELAGIFYSQSWALVHMLELSPKWRMQTPEYLERLGAGESAAGAFQKAFGRTLDKAVQDLRGYLTRMRSARLDVAIQPQGDTATVSKLDAAAALLERGDLALHCGQQDLAGKLFTDAARVHPGSPEAEAGLGTLAMMQNRRDDALAHLRRSIELRAPGGEKYFELAMLRQDEGAAAEEIDELLQRAVAADPSYAEAHLLLGERLTDHGDYLQAIPHLKVAASVLPRQSDIWHALAYAQDKAGLKDAARDSARRALQTARSAEHQRMAEVLLESLE